jgi:hypothetical protein
MQLLYMGFEQAGNVREYTFHGVTYGEETRVFIVDTDLALLREHHLGLQEGPILCLRTLTAELDTLGAAQLPGKHQIVERDIRAYLLNRLSAPAKKGFAKRASDPGGFLQRK